MLDSFRVDLRQVFLCGYMLLSYDIIYNRYNLQPWPCIG